MRLGAIPLFFGGGWEVGHGEWAAGVVLLVVGASFIRAAWME